MKKTVNDQLDIDRVLLISQIFPGAYADEPLPPPQVQKPRRQRRKKAEGGDQASISRALKRRKLTDEQMNMLEENFGSDHKLESERKDRLASELGLDPRQVAVWFQNRRARWKNKKLQEEYATLKSQHENTVLEKCHLSTEVIKLKEQLDHAMKEIQRLSISFVDGGVSSNSSISSISDVGPSFLGEFKTWYDDDGFYYFPHDDNGYVQGIELFNQYM